MMFMTLPSDYQHLKALFTPAAMGRTKYFTLAEWKAAAKVHRDNYNQSDR
jgi:hypothetical protein